MKRGRLYSLIFPPHCAACRRLLPFDGKGGERVLCRACRGAFEMAKLERCSVCGACFMDCRCMPEVLANAGCDGLVKLAAYDPADLRGVMNRLINNCKRYKDGNAFDMLASQLAVGLDKMLRELGSSRQNTVISFCPRSRRRVREYGFDQAEQLARRVSSHIGIGFDTLLLRRRSIRGGSQKKLDAEGRKSNAAHSVMLSEGKIPKGGTVVLVDDVVTSGATMAACVSLLKEAGVELVVALTLCEAVRDK